ncbi:Uncharacterised protein [Enterobacter ludwigii]|nr:Uncharacterised protein [Enterobacter ludwigii]SAG72032.1 Uncharacterised protein [Enterobacter ludwigii]
MPLFKVKGSKTKSFGTIHHSATRIICTSSEPKCWPLMLTTLSHVRLLAQLFSYTRH